MLLTPILLLMGVIGLLRRNGTAKKRFKWAGISFVLMIIVAIIASSMDEPTSTEVENNISNDSTSEVKNEEKEDKNDNNTKTKEDKVEEDKKKVEKTKPKKKENQMGKSIKVDNFEYVITAANEDTIIKSNNQFIDNKETEGKFAIIDYSVKNLDSKSRMVDSNLFQIKDKKGNKYDPMVDSDLFVILGDSNLFMEEVNPGLSRKGKIVFELPSDITDYSLEVSSGIGCSPNSLKAHQLKDKL